MGDHEVQISQPAAQLLGGLKGGGAHVQGVDEGAPFQAGQTRQPRFVVEFVHRHGIDDERRNPQRRGDRLGQQRAQVRRMIGLRAPLPNVIKHGGVNAVGAGVQRLEQSAAADARRQLARFDAFLRQLGPDYAEPELELAEHGGKPLQLRLGVLDVLRPELGASLVEGDLGGYAAGVDGQNFHR